MFRKEVNLLADSKISWLCISVSNNVSDAFTFNDLKTAIVLGFLVAKARDRSTERTCGGCRSRLGK